VKTNSLRGDRRKEEEGRLLVLPESAYEESRSHPEGGGDDSKGDGKDTHFRSDGIIPLEIVGQGEISADGDYGERDGEERGGGLGRRGGGIPM